ncbi:MAG: hypothetical protein V7711_15035 [Pseudomonadales bacterium]
MTTYAEDLLISDCVSIQRQTEGDISLPAVERYCQCVNGHYKDMLSSEEKLGLQSLRDKTDGKPLTKADISAFDVGYIGEVAQERCGPVLLNEPEKFQDWQWQSIMNGCHNYEKYPEDKYFRRCLVKDLVSIAGESGEVSPVESRSSNYGMVACVNNPEQRMCRVAFLDASGIEMFNLWIEDPDLYGVGFRVKPNALGLGDGCACEVADWHYLVANKLFSGSGILQDSALAEEFIVTLLDANTLKITGDGKYDSDKEYGVTINGEALKQHKRLIRAAIYYINEGKL